MFTTSYKDEGFENIITGLVQLYKPKIAVELGTQQGSSAILIAKAMEDDAKLYTYDLYDPSYDMPPHGETHANFKSVADNIVANNLQRKIEVCIGDAFEAYKDFDKVDMLHIDLCNYYNNVYRILSVWFTKVNKLILLEGGVHNSWQKKHGFKPFNSVFEEWFVYEFYDAIVFNNKSDYALSVLVRRPK